jgi:hypothetical protein
MTTGASVDGRPTVPGLQTDCIPGVLGSDCSPAQVISVKKKRRGVTCKHNTDTKHGRDRNRARARNSAWHRAEGSPRCS